MLTTQQVLNMIDHGKKLLAVFPFSSVKDPLVLFFKLQEIEDRMTEHTTLYYNTQIPPYTLQIQREQAREDLTNLLGNSSIVKIHGEPRGHILKINRSKVLELRKREIYLPTDPGGDGIVVPFFAEDETPRQESGLIPEVKALLSVISDDPNDYPDNEYFRIVQDKCEQVKRFIQ